MSSSSNYLKAYEEYLILRNYMSIIADKFLKESKLKAFDLEHRKKINFNIAKYNDAFKKGLAHINAAIAIALNTFSANKLNDLYNLKARLLDALGKTEEAKETYQPLSFCKRFYKLFD
jgi:hypothetical protein